MRKIVVLFLLTIFVGSFTFAIEGIGDFTAALDVTVADLANSDPKTDPLGIDIDPSITYSRAFGDFGLEAGLGNVIGLVLSDPAPKDPLDPLNDTLYLWVKPSYSLAAGPGTLGFDLTIKPYFYLASATSVDPDDPAFKLNPHVGYSFDPGFGTLGFDLGTEDLLIQKGGGKEPDDYGLGTIGLYFKAGIELPVGFNAYLKPLFGIATQEGRDSEFSNVTIGLGYQIIELVRADVDVTIPIGTEKAGTDFEGTGLTIAPKVTATFGAFEAYLGAGIGKIGAKLADEESISFELTLGASYSF